MPQAVEGPKPPVGETCRNLASYLHRHPSVGWRGQELMWQRPRGDVAALAFDADRRSLAATSFSPRQSVDPVERDDIEVEGCLVGAEGVLVVVPFGSEPRLIAHLSDPGLQQDVVVPLDSTEPIGIRNLTGGSISVRIEYFGEVVGSMDAPNLLAD